nr:hypothetical protein BaRGS_032974 [Batillaria attramentaria]
MADITCDSGSQLTQQQASFSLFAPLVINALQSQSPVLARGPVSLKMKDLQKEPWLPKPAESRAVAPICEHLVSAGLLRC